VKDTTSTNAEKQMDKYDANKGEIGEYSDTQPRIKIVQSIIHDGEVNRARYMPQNQDLIATKTAMGQVLVFDRTKHPTQPKEDDDKCRPDITLRGHTKEG
jgi:histone-binding protein RBBP4